MISPETGLLLVCSDVPTILDALEHGHRGTGFTSYPADVRRRGAHGLRLGAHRATNLARALELGLDPNPADPTGPERATAAAIADRLVSDGWLDETLLGPELTRATVAESILDAGLLAELRPVEVWP